MDRVCPKGPLGFFAARKARDSYHHGHLKLTLLDTAETLIAERGPANLSLSEMARMAGVSSAAVYRHYADLNALIGAVAHRGFEDFAARLKAGAAVAGSGVDGLRGMGRAYLDFARERPGAYAAMFSSTVSYTDPGLAAAGETAFNTLIQGVSATLSKSGMPAEAAYGLALKIWALAHGVATLAGSGRLTPAVGIDPATLLSEAVTALLSAESR
ncbi:MAG TPA: TetR/AcrR family transcriptional regulator [Beijerinckiaceae bacterium]|mgnify:CR=1 FL=1|nr:TetR/AcrR family transcriptional regulator [Beijerinckiaceae bacterium]